MDLELTLNQLELLVVFILLAGKEVFDVWLLPVGPTFRQILHEFCEYRSFGDTKVVYWFITVICASLFGGLGR